MLCNIAFILTILSAIIVIGVIIDVYSKNNNISNNNKNNNNNNNNNTLEHFTQEEDITANNTLITQKLNRLKELQIEFMKKNVNGQQIESTLSSELEKTINRLKDQIISGAALTDNTKLDTLNNQITDLENRIYNYKKENTQLLETSKIKSLNNGLEIDLIKTPNTYYADESTGLNQAAHLVNVNCGCLSVSPTDYDVYKCNDENPKQFFKIQNILNETDYLKNIDYSMPFEDVNVSKIQYPFAMIKSVNNGNCLTNNHGTLTVQPCYTYNAQRWMPM